MSSQPERHDVRFVIHSTAEGRPHSWSLTRLHYDARGIPDVRLLASGLLHDTAEPDGIETLAHLVVRAASQLA